MSIDLYELAWAAGFFDGEGNIRCNFQEKNNHGFPSAYMTISISQRDRRPLDRLKKIFNCGTVNGPYYKARNEHELIHAYVISNFEQVQFVISSMWKYLAEPKREQTYEALSSFYALRKQYNISTKNRYRATQKISDEQVLEIRLKAKNYYHGLYKDLADEYGIDQGHISSIVANKRRHLTNSVIEVSQCQLT